MVVVLPSYLLTL